MKQIEGPITKFKSFTMEESTMNKFEAGSKPGLCAHPLGKKGFTLYNYLKVGCPGWDVEAPVSLPPPFPPPPPL